MKNKIANYLIITIAVVLLIVGAITLISSIYNEVVEALNKAKDI